MRIINTKEGEYVLVKDAAKMLGYSLDWTYQLTRLGKLSTETIRDDEVQFGNKLRKVIPLSEITEWLEESGATVSVSESN